MHAIILNTTYYIFYMKILEAQWELEANEYGALKYPL